MAGERPVGFAHGVPAYRPPAPLRLLDHQRAEDRRSPGGRRRDRLRVRQPRPAVARRGCGEALAEAAQNAQATTGIRPAEGHPEAARGGICQPLRAPVRGHPRSRHRGHQHHRRQGRPLPPHVDAGPTGRRGAWCHRRRIPIHLYSSAVRRRRQVREIPLSTRVRASSSAMRERAWEYSVAASPEGHPRHLVPAQPHHHLRRSRLHAPRWSTSRNEKNVVAGARLRLRRPRLRRLQTRRRSSRSTGAKDCCGRALLDDQVVLDGRLAGGVPAGQPRGGRGAGEAQVAISTTARSSPSRSRPR